MSAPKRSRRVVASRGITLNEKLAKTHVWKLIKRSITALFDDFAEVVAAAEFDVEEQLSAFVVPIFGGILAVT